MELTNNLRKLVSSLDERKHRKSNGLFKVEGTKCVGDTLESFSVFAIFATSRWIDTHQDTAHRYREYMCQVSERDLERMSSLKTPQGVIAVYEVPVYDIREVRFSGRLTMALDGVQDPGNLGTIIRTADWFGITDILCSEHTADIWNPKVVQATMGAISRVRLHYGNLLDMLKDCKVKVYGTFLEGQNIYGADLESEGVIVMGNEGNGICDAIREVVTDKLYVPSFGTAGKSSESLNVAVATAITMSEFRRRTVLKI